MRNNERTGLLRFLLRQCRAPGLEITEARSEITKKKQLITRMKSNVISIDPIFSPV